MELRSECRPPDFEAAKTISERGSIDQHVGLMAHFCEPALHQHAYWNITQQEVIHIPPSCQVPPMALQCCQKVPLRSGLKITFCLHPFETCCQQYHQQLGSHQKCQSPLNLERLSWYGAVGTLEFLFPCHIFLWLFLLLCVHFLTRYFTFWLACLSSKPRLVIPCSSAKSTHLSLSPWF